MKEKDLSTLRGPSPGAPAPPLIQVDTHFLVQDSALADFGFCILCPLSAPASLIQSQSQVVRNSLTSKDLCMSILRNQVQITLFSDIHSTGFSMAKAWFESNVIWLKRWCSSLSCRQKHITETTAGSDACFSILLGFYATQGHTIRDRAIGILGVLNITILHNLANTYFDSILAPTKQSLTSFTLKAA